MSKYAPHISSEIALSSDKAQRRQEQKNRQAEALRRNLLRRKQVNSPAAASEDKEGA